MVRAYEKAEYAGYYEVAGAKPRSVIVLKQPAGELPAVPDSCGYAEIGAFIRPPERSAGSSIPAEKSM